MKRLQVGDIIGQLDTKRIRYPDDHEGKDLAVMPCDVGSSVAAADPDWNYYTPEREDLNKRREILDSVTDRVIGLPMVDTPQTYTPSKESVCEEADRLVDGDRNDAYGHPKEDFKCVGEMWGLILKRPPISPAIVGLMMLTMKVSREVHKPKRDTLVDICGYAKCLDMISEADK